MLLEESGKLFCLSARPRTRLQSYPSAPSDSTELVEELFFASACETATILRKVINHTCSFSSHSFVRADDAQIESSRLQKPALE